MSHSAAIKAPNRDKLFCDAGMAKLADAADLKSAGPKGLWGFDSPSRHQFTRVNTAHYCTLALASFGSPTVVCDAIGP